MLQNRKKRDYAMFMFAQEPADGAALLVDGSHVAYDGRASGAALRIAAGCSAFRCFNVDRDSSCGIHCGFIKQYQGRS